MATKWIFIHMNDEENIIFANYKKFRKRFLERFIDSNLSEIAIEKLLNLWKEKTTKIVNLAYQVNLEDQTIKALIFRRLHLKNQNRIMLVNSIKTKTKLRIENMEIYLGRIIWLLRWKKIWRQESKEDNLIDEITYKSTSWRQEEDPMELNNIQIKKSWKCFRCKKTEYIYWFCKKKEKILVSLKTKNEKLLI